MLFLAANASRPPIQRLTHVLHRYAHTRIIESSLYRLHTSLRCRFTKTSFNRFMSSSFVSNQCQMRKRKITTGLIIFVFFRQIEKF